MDNTKLLELPHITRTNIVKIAKSGGIDRRYAWMLINNKRPANSTRAKAIVKTAKSINEAIERRLMKLEAQISEID
jgi:hypothetical protein